MKPTNWEDALGHVKARAELTNLLRDGLVRQRFSFGDGFCVESAEEVLPRRADVSSAAVIGALINQKAEVVVTRLVGVAIVKLEVG